LSEESEPEKLGPKWVCWSTEESVERGVISVLACVEVMVGIRLFWWLTPYWFDMTIHLLISVIVAPFLLLRSTGSIRTALEGFKRYDNNKTRVSLKSARGIGFLWAVAGIASGMWCQSVFEKIKATLCHLPEGCSSLAENWRELVWVQDFLHPLELLLGIERATNLDGFTMREISRIDHGEEGGNRIFWSILKYFLIPTFFIPAWLYRLSLKSTCWFWWPLVFVLNSGRKTGAAVTAGDPGIAAARF